MAVIWRILPVRLMVNQHQTSPGQELLTAVLLNFLSLSVNRMKGCTDVLLTMALVIQPAEMSLLLFNVSHESGFLFFIKLFMMDLFIIAPTWFNIIVILSCDLIRLYGVYTKENENDL